MRDRALEGDLLLVPVVLQPVNVRNAAPDLGKPQVVTQLRQLRQRLLGGPPQLWATADGVGECAEEVPFQQRVKLGSSVSRRRAGLDGLAERRLRIRELPCDDEGAAKLDEEILSPGSLRREQRGRAGKEARGSPRISPRERSSARGREQLAGARSQTRPGFAPPPGLAPMAVRLLGVVAEYLVDLPRPFARCPLEPFREALVQLGPCLLRDADVGLVADQDVPEAEGVLPGEYRAVRTDHLLADEREEMRSQGGAFSFRREEGDRAAPKLPADDGGSFDQRTLRGLQTVEAGSEQSMNRRRNRELRRWFPGLDHREHLLDEQRVSIGRVGNCAQDVRADFRIAAQKVEELRGLLVRKWLEPDRARVARDQPGGAPLEQLGAREAKNEERSVAGPACEVLDQVEEGFVGPLEIVERENHGSPVRQPFE